MFDLSVQEKKRDFISWISSKSTKVVDELNAGAYQIMELAQRNMMILFVDLSHEVYGRPS